MAGYRHKLFLLCFGLACAAMAAVVRAERPPGQCLDCHDVAGDEEIHGIMNTAHAALAGGGSEGCQACHGSSEAHATKPTQNAPDVSFGPTWPMAAEIRNASCLGCHGNGDQLLWAGSQHQQENLGCNDCHNSHQQQDLVTGDVASQQTCLNCHAQVRSQLHLPSRHPIAEGKTSCVDCHNPHGGLSHAQLREVSVNDNCFSCHADKRGPFLWEHPPAAEDCTLCHRPHGSVNEPLLNARGPALCQQCHAAAFHPSQPYGSEGLPGGSANQNMLGKNCLNCHSQIHGSNHPSGARLTR
jgi:DmsE family decaheme c-type cytochrome